MNKKVLLIAAIVVVAIVACVLVILTINGGQQRAEDQLREENPIFHTVEEGGACRDGEGDCLPGLTCEEGVCVTY